MSREWKIFCEKLTDSIPSVLDLPFREMNLVHPDRTNELAIPNCLHSRIEPSFFCVVMMMMMISLELRKNLFRFVFFFVGADFEEKQEDVLLIHLHHDHCVLHFDFLVLDLFLLRLLVVHHRHDHHFLLCVVDFFFSFDFLFVLFDFFDFLLSENYYYCYYRFRLEILSDLENYFHHHQSSFPFSPRFPLFQAQTEFS